jgi:photosystem II oxygen-evolving enhancer protein 2
LLLAPSAFAEKGLKGFVAMKDQQDGYTFVYPFGWQEVAIDGQDSVFKDIIEPLESVSVSIVPSDKKTIDEYGDIKEVTYTLADKVLTGPSQKVTMVGAAERTGNDGRKYFDFEFLVNNPRYTRHAVASVTVGNGKFYTLVTGANEKRWGKMGDKVKTVVKSFDVSDRY